MADQSPHALAQQASPMPYVKITVTGSDGGPTEKDLMAPITIRIPRELSLRIATMHVMEFVMKEFKRTGSRTRSRRSD